MDTNKLRVLVVEDEVIIRRMIVNQIEKCNATVIGETGSGVDAVSFVKNNTVDFICMDITLDNGMDGIQAAREITKNRPIPVLFISAYNETDTIKDGINCAGYIHKPFKTDELSSIINRQFNILCR